ncbi:MAG: lytic transglycosylase domain-containing protein [Magnetococcales bacterium]|nr:lytic transglycosylase domain-containing protein [Magnetococcales bacterium]
MNSFNELLLQAVEERGGLTQSDPLSHSKINALVEAVVSALRQAKDSMHGGGGLPTALSGGGASGFEETRPFVSSPPNLVNTSAMKHAKPPKPSIDPALKISLQREGGSYDEIIQRASERYGVDADLIRSVIQVESSFNPKAVSPAGAQGMMQLMPGTAKELGVRDPFNAEENIMGGTLYLSRLLDRYDGDIRSALAAYNWGMGNLERQPASAMPGETRRYVSRIMGMVDGKTMG